MSRDRDDILEKALKHELRAAGTTPDGACLDAETLGAWTDGGLEPAAMASVEAHISTCARCQALVGVMVRSTVGTPRTLRTPRTLFLWWLAPIAAGAAAVTLWMVVPEQQNIATAPAAETSLPSVSAEKDKAVAEPSDRLAARDSRANKVTAPAREDRQRQQSGARKEEEVAALQESVKLADAAAPRAEAAAPPASAAPPAPAAPAPQAAAARQAPAELAALQKNERAIAAPPGIEVTAQSAPSDSVCWFVGRAGLVLLTTDAGATFKRVDLAERLDIITVSATDARIAVVTTAGGRRFRTEDGGTTWRPF